MKISAVLFTIALAVLALSTPPSCSGEDLDDPNLRVFEGNVSSVDAAGSRLTVDGTVKATFSVSEDTDIISEVDMYADDIELSDIASGDYVKVEYLPEKEGVRACDTALRISVEHSPKDIEGRGE